METARDLAELLCERGQAEQVGAVRVVGEVAKFTGLFLGRSVGLSGY